ncbi:MAG: hypothetical protein Q4C70_05340 [Planctomycetia bacterium]|nr:hypothetical protein [Planctomycetia bacterium]
MENYRFLYKLACFTFAVFPVGAGMFWLFSLLPGGVFLGVVCAIAYVYIMNKILDKLYDDLIRRIENIDKPIQWGKVYFALFLTLVTVLVYILALGM